MKSVWQHSIEAVRDLLDVSELNLDGSHTIAKKGGESVVYQGRKKAKTSNILPIFDKQGYVLASTGIVAGNHNDAFNLKSHLQSAFKWLKRQSLSIQGSYFNADSAFDTKKLARFVSIINSYQIFQKTNVIASKLSQDQNACSIRMCIKDALQQNVPLLGLISFELCLSGMIAATFTSYLDITSLLL